MLNFSYFSYFFLKIFEIFLFFLFFNKIYENFQVILRPSPASMLADLNSLILSPDRPLSVAESLELEQKFLQLINGPLGLEPEESQFSHAQFSHVDFSFFNQKLHRICAENSPWNLRKRKNEANLRMEQEFPLANAISNFGASLSQELALIGIGTAVGAKKRRKSTEIRPPVPVSIPFLTVDQLAAKSRQLRQGPFSNISCLRLKPQSKVWRASLRLLLA